MRKGGPVETLRLCWLGHPLVELDGRAVKLETRKAAALLSYLSLTPGECRRELLATMFWPEANQQKALANFRRTLSSLNSSLPGWIEADRESVALKQNGKLWVDVDAFHQFLSQLQQHDHSEKAICDGCLAILKKAVETYRGEFLEGLNLTDAPNFDEWQFFQRDGLRLELAAALQRLSAGYAERGHWDQAIACARRWVALDRLHEPAHRALMDLFARAGQKTAALRQYEELARLLHEQLGQEPELETQRLCEQLRGREDAHIVKKPVGFLSPFPLLKTKLYIPTVPASRVVRSYLIDRLDKAGKKALTIISAPAGFGKTTLLAEWIAKTSLPVAWLSLDSGDNDPYRFLSYLIAALESIQEGVGTEAQQLLRSTQLLPSHIVLASLINDLGKVAEPYLLALDDYQFITERAVQETVSYLLDHLPSNMHLLISTRADPPLQLGRLRAHDQMLELRTQDLRFTSSEATEFLNQVMRLELSLEDIEALQARTEGWVAGLQMAALSLKGHENASEFIRAFSGSHRYVLDYLVEEVLNRQPIKVRSFLLRTSVLDRMCFQLCDSLITEDNTEESQQRDEVLPNQQILEYLERSNLFLIPLDDERRWFRYHHLFADLLHVRLQQQEPELKAVLHRRAANWYAQNSYPVEAVKHALEAGDFSLAADIIEDYSMILMGRNQIVITPDWFKSLPPGIIQSHPLLMIYQAYILARRGELNSIESILVEAEKLIQIRPGLNRIDELKDIILGMRAYIANLRGDSETAIQVGLGIPTLPTYTYTKSNFLARFEHALAYYSMGDLDTAEHIWADISRRAEESEDIFHAIAAKKELANIWMIRGYLRRAQQCYQEILDWVDQKTQEPALVNGLVKVWETILLIEQNELEKALTLLEGDIERLLGVWRTSSLGFSYAVLVSLYTAQRDFPRARTTVENAFQQLTYYREYPRTISMVTADRVNLWLAEGNLAEAQKWAQTEFPQIPVDYSFAREIDHICLARVLVASRRCESAFDLLQCLSREAEKGKRLGRLLKINILQTLALSELNRSEEAMDLLENCLQFAQKEGFIRVFIDEGVSMKALIQRGKQERGWQDPELSSYIEKLLAAF
jgi:LuxR family maltose regulon positive regulatory protein